MDGQSNGIAPLRHTATDTEIITSGPGLLNHYRVFTLGKRYGYGARRWPSTAKLQDDGSVEVFWEANDERPFDLRGTYTWVNPHTLDLTTTVRAKEKLAAFEVFIASYYLPPFIDSRVWAERDPRSGDQETGDQESSNQEGFVSADEELGVWQAFPRDPAGAAVIEDGRWDLEPHPLDWNLLPNYALPLAIRRDPSTDLTVVLMAKRDDCFGVFTPYGTEKHYSNYLSLFGHDIEAGTSVSAHTRQVVMAAPSEAEILEVAKAYL